MKRLAAVVLLVVIAGCAPTPGGRLFRASLPGTNQPGAAAVHSLAVVLGDETGLVTAMTLNDVPEPSDSAHLSLRATPGPTDQLVATWLGGPCDAQATFSFRPADAGFELHQTITLAFPTFQCPAAGIPREVTISLSQPIDPTQIELSESRP